MKERTLKAVGIACLLLAAAGSPKLDACRIAMSAGTSEPWSLVRISYTDQPGVGRPNERLGALCKKTGLMRNHWLDGRLYLTASRLERR
jgi:hypothetical protein